MRIKYDNEQQSTELSFLLNTPEAGLFSNIEINSKRGLTQVEELPATDQPAVIVGGGPSMASLLEEIKEMKAHSAKVYALNNAAEYLFDAGIVPDAQIMCDARECNVDFVLKPWANEAMLCSQVHPLVFDKCSEVGYPVRLWHAAIEGIEKHLATPAPILISSHWTVGLAALCLVYTLGHRHFILYGYDSCHSGNKSHAYEQKINEGDDRVRVAVDNRAFECSLMMAGQAVSFEPIAEMLANLDCTIDVRGDGLIPHIVKYRKRLSEQKILKAVYDLAHSPPTYDFLSFLIEAERHRLNHGFDLIDVIFEPGPMHGFRDDQLPPDIETRRGMLWRVCVAMARLLPSVRNVTVLKDRENIVGSVFPEQWKEDAPLSHYGTCYLKNGGAMLKASESARKQIALRFSKPYATISLREASYWPSRNSNFGEWSKVARWLLDNNIQPVIVPDTEGIGLVMDNEMQEFTAASFDLDLRAALYEGAVINLGVLNGPMSVCAFLECKYLIFNVVNEDAIASSSAFLGAHGFHEGDSFSSNGKLIWKKDTAENILAELQHLTKETTSCPV